MGSESKESRSNPGDDPGDAPAANFLEARLPISI